MNPRGRFWRQRAADAVGAIFPALGAGVLAGSSGASTGLAGVIAAGTAGAWMLLVPLGRRLVSPRDERR